MFANPFNSKPRGGGRANLVPRSNSSVCVQRGWKSHADGWHGPYATRYGTWNGKIERAGGILRPFIQYPPNALRRHQKWHCFHEDRRPGWWRIHLQTQPSDGSIDSVILYIERLITEALTS